MLEVEAALELVLAHAEPRPREVTALTSSALGQVLADDLVADTDSPPFAKALMDGYALRSADLAGGTAELTIVEEVAAGAVPTRPVGPGEAAAIYTGAPLPDGADAVVKVELTERLGDRVRVSDPSLKPGRNVMGRGDEMRVGQVVLPRGTVVTPVAFGLCAAVGKTAVLTVPPARVSILVTGDELVEANMKPRGGQIRNTNGPMLVAQAVRAGALPRYLGIVRDDPAILKSVVREGLLTTDVVVLAGGVSAGRYDHVPAVLAEMGVEVAFHKVRMKPGKPLLFGTKGQTLVFGLPGNPVGAFVAFELFVKPALLALGGQAQPRPLWQRFTLSQPLEVANDRPTYYPARRVGEGRVEPLAWGGSADLKSVLGADVLLALPAGEFRGGAGDGVAGLEV